jgi:hypothetical protein
MERHAINPESCIYQLQDEIDGTIHGGSGKPDDCFIEEEDIAVFL